MLGAVALLVSCGSRCPNLSCPRSDVQLTVTDPNGHAVSHVEVTSSNVSLSCTATATGTVCDFIGAGPLHVGTGPLHIEAPGFQTVDLNATVTETQPDSACPSCPEDTLNPSHVTLQPSDGGAP